MKIGPIRTTLQVLSIFFHNLGFTFSLKTGIVTPALYCYACPLASFACPIGTLQHFCALTTLPLYVVGSLGLSLTVAGRSFCGHVCPFGSLHDLIASVKSKSGSSNNLRAFPATKFVMLFMVLALAWYTVDTFYCKFCPSASLFASIPYILLNPSTGIPFYFLVHMLTLVAIVALAFYFTRFWCRYLCPMGALSGAFNKISILKIRLNKAKCTGCMSCLRKCPMRISDVNAISASTDCILCGRCVDECQNQALAFTQTA